MSTNDYYKLRVFKSFVATFFIIFVIFSLPAYSKNTILSERAWVYDESAALTLEQVQQLELRPFTGVLSKGFGSGAVWVRVLIDSSRAAADEVAHGPLVVVIGPAYLDEVVVYDPLAAAGVAGVVGDRRHPSSDLIRGTHFIVPLQQVTEPRSIWLRLTSTSTRQISVEVRTLSQHQSERLTYDILSSLAITIVFLFFLWSLVNAAVKQDSLMGAFAAKQMGALLISITVFGYARVYWPDGWSAFALDYLGSFASIFAVLSGTFFHMRLLKDYDLPRWAWRLLVIIFLASVFNMIVLIVGDTRLALTSNMSVTLLAPFLVLMCALSARIWERDPKDIPNSILPKWVIVSLYGAIIAILALSSSAALSLSQAYEWTIYVGLIHGLLSGLLVTLMLQFRSYRMTLEQQASKLQLQRSLLDSEHQKQRRREQGQLLEMLAHEIKTPMATIQLRLNIQKNPEIPVVLKQLNNVIDKCLQAQLADEDSLKTNPQEIDFAEFFQEVRLSSKYSERIDLIISEELKVYADRELLFIVLSNLIDNSGKYSASESIINFNADVFLNEAGVRFLKFRISNLPGQANWPDGSRVFEKFYRSPHAQRQAGTGLGLYIVRTVLGKLGGHIAYQPTGSLVIFEVILPLQPL